MTEMRRQLVFFVVVPVLLYALLMGLYFSGVYGLQQIVAPTLEGLSRNIWREFGLLEQLQNIFLLVVIFFLLKAAITRENVLDKVCFFGGTLVFVFLFLEEIDYGIHFYEAWTGEDSGIQVRNWHNQETNGKQNVKRFKQGVDLLMFVLFIVLPLLRDRISVQFIRNITPSRWFIAGFAVCLALAKFAHVLDDQGMGMIGGVEGNLSGNISEFRELSNYYFFMLYALQLLKTGPLFDSRLAAQR